MLNKRIELLAPARDLATGRVAVDCGADAIYVGGPGFGARRDAGNSVEDVAALVRYARPFGVRVYAALNTLLFDDELEEAQIVARNLIDAGVDALIVQDMAFMRMGLSGVEFHASTQTSNILPEDVAFWGRAGFRRVILERALSLDEIRAIRVGCPEDTELEVFVHGAICVGYSGRCFMSRATGSSGGIRSGNRGDCSQPCRLSYDLTDGSGRVLSKGKHLLSVRDLDLSGRLGELLDAGVKSFKIEGRLKDASYVRNVVSYYRRLLDTALTARPELRRASVGLSKPDFVPDPAKSFTRGATEYFFDGARRGVASFDTPKAMGEPVGTVGRLGSERTGNRFFTLDGKDSCELRAGDGICFFADGELQGTNINRVEGERIYPNRCEGIASGMKLYRNHDHTFVHSLEHSRMKRRIGVTARVETVPSCVKITFTDETGVCTRVVREGGFKVAHDLSKMTATALEQLSRRWGSGWAIVVSALFFGLVHLNPTQAVNAFVMGIVLGYIYVVTRSLTPVIVIHAVNNGIAYLLLEMTGTQNTDTRTLLGNDTLYWAIYGASAAVFAASIVLLWLFARRKETKTDKIPLKDETAQNEPQP